MGGESEVPPAVVDERRSELLRRITEEGGFSYAISAEAAAAGDLEAAEAAREMAREQLHSGPWNEVIPAWRDAYSMACLHVAELHAASSDHRDALRALDMGLIMGGTLLRRDLDAAVIRITAIGEAEGSGGKQQSENLAEHSDSAEALLILPKRSLSCKVVEKRTSLSLERFVCDHFLQESPVVICGYIDHWPARTKWKDIEYLKRIAGDRTVPVEVGKNYLSPEWKQELITFSQFLERIQSDDCPTNLTYLAQHPLFDQVVGRKYIRLYPTSVTEDLYPYSESMLSNSSQVDLDNLNAEAFPRAEGLDFMDCVLEEGDMLYIPPKWWHYVRSLSASFSVSFWWSSNRVHPEKT